MSVFRSGPGVRDSEKRTEPWDKQRSRADCSPDNERTHSVPRRSAGQFYLSKYHSSQNMCGPMIPKHSHRTDPRNTAQISANLRRFQENPGQRRVCGAVRGQMVLTFAEMSDPESTCVSAIACVNKIKDG